MFVHDTRCLDRQHTPRYLRTRSRWQWESARQPRHSSPAEAARVEHLSTRGTVVGWMVGWMVGWVVGWEAGKVITTSKS